MRKATSRPRHRGAHGPQQFGLPGYSFQSVHRHRSQGSEALRRARVSERARPSRPRLLPRESFRRRRNRSTRRTSASFSSSSNGRRPAERATDVVAFESRIAAASWTKTQQRDPVTTYNPVTLEGLQALAPGFDWKAFLAGAGLGKCFACHRRGEDRVPEACEHLRRNADRDAPGLAGVSYRRQRRALSLDAICRRAFRDAKQDAGRPATADTTVEACGPGNRRWRFSA